MASQIFIYLILIFICKSRSEISTTNNQLGLKLYSASAEEVEGDFLIAPFPLSTVLAQLNLGADGKTRKEIENVLEFQGEASDVSNDYRRVLSDFKELDFLDGVASQIFVNSSVKLLKDFEESSEKYFLNVPSKTNFNATYSREMNAWIENKAINKRGLEWIPGGDPYTLPSNDSTSSALFVVTTSFFKGSWVNSFHPIDTKPSPFYYDECRACSNQVDMMFQRAQVPFAELEELDCTSIALPYRTNYSAREDKESRVELIILLPNTRTGLGELERKLKNIPFSQITSRFLEMKDLFIYMPKFNVSYPYSQNMGQILLKLGLKEGFDHEKADFSKMQVDNTKNPLWVFNVFHFGEFSTDEFGTNGVGSPVSRSSTNHFSPESFRVNRPFIGVLYDQERHIILNIFRKTK